MLSWGSGQIPIAIVRGSKGGKNDGNILYLSDKASASADSFADVELLDGQCTGSSCQCSTTQSTTASASGTTVTAARLPQL